MTIELPFVAFALLLPFVAGGPRRDVGPVSLSIDGLWGAWNVLAKGTLGVGLALVLTMTTPVADVIRGLQRLRMPSALVGMLTFMVRYIDVVAGDLQRMRVARVSRGNDARWPWQARAVAQTAGTLFVRSYEHGERVYLAMQSRGFTGQMPSAGGEAAAARDWVTALGPVLMATLVASVAVVGPTMTEPALHVSALTYAYPDGTLALRDVSFTVEVGERVAVLGGNGAGKTTLVLHLNGVLGGGPGEVRVGGLTVAKDSIREVRRRVGIVFQDPDDQLFMPTVGQDVAFGPANAGRSGAELSNIVQGALAAVGMAHVADRAPHHLSFGQRRRVAVATVLAMQPHVLVLDEPTSNLDPASRRELSDVIRSLDLTTLIVTHDLPYALELCPRALILNEGAIVADGPTIVLLADERVMADNRLELPVGFDVHRFASERHLRRPRQVAQRPCSVAASVRSENP